MFLQLVGFFKLLWSIENVIEALVVKTKRYMPKITVIKGAFAKLVEEKVKRSSYYGFRKECFSISSRKLT